MKLKNELQYRLSSTADFLESCWNGTQFIHGFIKNEKPSKEFNILHHLQTISILISLAEFLGRNHLRSIADEAFEITLSWKFDAGDSSFIVHNDESFLSWNALVAIIHLKRKEIEKSRNFVNSILECIGDDTVSPVYPPDFEKPPTSLAEAILALILVSAKEKDDSLEDAAAYMAEILLNQNVLYNHYEVWAFTLLYNIEQDPRYLKRARHQVKEFQQPAAQAMTSLFAACAQQAFLAAYPHVEWLGKNQKYANYLHMKVLNQQVSLQVDKDKSFEWPQEFNGAFVLRKTRPNIRLDYALQNAMAIMQFISHLTNQKTLAII